MKKIILLSTLICFSVFCSFAQMSNLTTDQVKKLKAKKLIVALKEYPKNATQVDMNYIDSSNVAIKFAFSNSWTFNEIHDYMPVSKAKEFVKGNKDSYFYIVLEDIEVKRNVNSQSIRYITKGEFISIYSTSRIYNSFVPYYEGPLDNALATYAVKYLQYTLVAFDTGEVKSLYGFSDVVKKSALKLKERKLLIPVEFINPEITEEAIKNVYKYPFEICPYEKVKKAILDNDKTVGICVFISLPVSARYIDLIYVALPETAEVCANIQCSPTSSVSLGVFGMTGKRKEYLINEKQLPLFKTIINEGK